MLNVFDLKLEHSTEVTDIYQIMKTVEVLYRDSEEPSQNKWPKNIPTVSGMGCNKVENRSRLLQQLRE